MNFFKLMYRIIPLHVIQIIFCTVVFLITFSVFFVLDIINEKKSNVVDENTKTNIITDNTYVNPKDMIFDFYNQYLSSSLNETDRHALIKKYCTNNMLEILNILYSFDEEKGLIIGIDYDPFLNAQDFFPIENIEIERIETNKYKVSWNNTNNTIVILNVIKENSNWKIDSVDIDRLEQIKKDVIDYWNKKGRDIPKTFNL